VKSTDLIQTCPFPRLIYSSSADRGLDTLLYLFQFIRKEFPQATLHILYGFENWNLAIDQRNNAQEKRWRDQIIKDMEQPGVHYYGRVSQDVVAKMYQFADLWFYPTRFTETFCWLPGTKVQSGFDMISMDKLSTGDMVLTHTGQHKQIIEILSRLYQGEVLDIESTTTMRHLHCTPEHPMLAVLRKNQWQGPQWVVAGKLSKKDYLVFPVNRKTADIERLQVSQIIDRQVGSYRVEEGMIAARSEVKNRTYTAKIQENIEITEEFMRLCGFYLAEGSSCLNRSIVCFSFNSDEQDFISDVQFLAQKVFNISPNRVETIDSTTNIIYNSRILGEFFISLFGSGAAQKSLPDWFMTLPAHKQKQLLVGLFQGDGCFIRRTNSVKMELASEKLIRQVWQILLRFDVVGGLYENFKRVPKHPLGSGYHEEKRAYYTISYQWRKDDLNEAIGFKGRVYDKKTGQHSKIIGDYLWMPIRSIQKTPYKGVVYNLEVEDEHSYVVENVATHNCITALEAQISKTAIVCTDLAALHTTVGDKGILLQGDAYTKEYREKALQEVFAILKDEKRRNEMVERAFQWAKQQTWETRAKEMLQIFGAMK